MVNLFELTGLWNSGGWGERKDKIKLQCSEDINLINCYAVNNMKLSSYASDMMAACGASFQFL